MQFLAAIGLVMFGFFIGYIYPKINTPKGNKIEYYVELRGNTAVIENDWGNVYECPIDSITTKLIQDNQ